MENGNDYFRNFKNKVSPEVIGFSIVVSIGFPVIIGIL